MLPTPLMMSPPGSASMLLCVKDWLCVTETCPRLLGVKAWLTVLAWASASGSELERKPALGICFSSLAQAHAPWANHRPPRASRRLLCLLVFLLILPRASGSRLAKMQTALFKEGCPFKIFIIYSWGLMSFCSIFCDICCFLLLKAIYANCRNFLFFNCFLSL